MPGRTAKTTNTAVAMAAHARADHEAHRLGECVSFMKENKNGVCPWAGGNDEDYFVELGKLAKAAQARGGELWGMVNAHGPSYIPSWREVRACIDEAQTKGGFVYGGVLIDVEGIDPGTHCVPSVSDLSPLKTRTRSVWNRGHTCANFTNPDGHEYEVMCYDGQSCDPYVPPVPSQYTDLNMYNTPSGLGDLYAPGCPS